MYITCIQYTELVELEIKVLHSKKKAGFQDSEKMSIKRDRPLLAQLQHGTPLLLLAVPARNPSPKTAARY